MNQKYSNLFHIYQALTLALILSIVPQSCLSAVLSVNLKAGQEHCFAFKTHGDDDWRIRYVFSVSQT